MRTLDTLAVEALLESLNWGANKAPLVFLTTTGGYVLSEAVYRRKMHFEVDSQGAAEEIRGADGLILHTFDAAYLMPGDSFDIEIGIS